MIIIIVICFVVGLTCFGELGLEERTNAGEWSERKESSPQALTVATSALAGSGSQGPLREARLASMSAAPPFASVAWVARLHGEWRPPGPGVQCPAECAALSPQGAPQ